VNILEAALRRIAADLERYGRRWALVGGFAVSARANLGSPVTSMPL